MKLPPFVNLPTPDSLSTQDEVVEYLERLVRSLVETLNTFVQIVNGRLSFGDGSNLDNMKGTYVDITMPATPGTDLAVSHNNEAVPPGILTLYQEQAGSIEKGATSWTSSTIYLKSDTANLKARIFIL